MTNEYHAWYTPSLYQQLQPTRNTFSKWAMKTQGSEANLEIDQTMKLFAKLVIAAFSSVLQI